MKKVLLISIFISISLFLTGCNDEYPIASKEFLFLEKTTNFSKPLFIFESKEDKKYYGVVATNWEYDNISFENGEILDVETRKNKNADGIAIAFNLGTDFGVETELEAFIMDDWQNLYELTKYTKSE